MIGAYIVAGIYAIIYEELCYQIARSLLASRADSKRKNLKQVI